MNWSRDMELVCKPTYDALVVGPELVTRGFCLPWRQTSMIRSWTECHNKILCWKSRVSWSSRTDLERFPLSGAPLLTSRHQIFRMRIGKSTSMRNQSCKWPLQFLYWFRSPRRVIALHSVSLYYAMKFDTSDRLPVAAFYSLENCLIETAYFQLWYNSHKHVPDQDSN
jgi:hypothetical protein